MKINTKAIALLAALLLLADRGLTGSGMETAAAEGTPAAVMETAAPTPTAAPPSPVPTAVGESYTDKSDGGHAIAVDGEKAAYSNITVSKTGDADGDEADLNGVNAAVLAANAGELTLRASSVTTDGAHANAVFGCGGETAVNVADSTIATLGDGSCAVMAVESGAINADNLVVHTYGASSAAIRAERGGAVYVNGGTYSTDGADSPVVFSAAEISVADAELSSTASQVVTVEGSHAVRLENVTLTANNTETQEEQARQAVLFRRSASDAAGEGTASFTMLGGSLTNLSGDVFSVSGADALIQLCKADSVNDDPDGVFLRAAAADRGDGSGSRAVLRAAAQEIGGNILVDGVSALDLYLGEGAVFTGAVQAEDGGKVYVELDDDGKWILTGDSSISSLRCRADSVTLNGFTLTVNGEPYTEGTVMTGDPVSSARAA